MSNLTSLRAIVKLRIHQNSSYVDLAIADAMKHVRNEPLWFNTTSFTFATVADTIDYPLPSDFLSIQGSVFYTPDSSDDSGRYALLPITLDELETYRYKQDFEGDEIKGHGRRYAIDYAGKRMYIAPVPTDAGDKVFYRYLRDLGTPVYTVAATASAPPSLSPTVTLLAPDGTTLPSDFTNDWFTHGFQLLAHRVVHTLWSQYHGGSEESQMNANQAQIAYLEELARLRGETAMKVGGARIRPHFP